MIHSDPTISRNTISTVNVQKKKPPPETRVRIREFPALSKILLAMNRVSNSD
jgi:hypothetical protein